MLLLVLVCYNHVLDQMLLKLLDGKITVITKARLQAIKNRIKEIKTLLESGNSSLTPSTSSAVVVTSQNQIGEYRIFIE